jgi:hypothetical protein
MHQKAKSSIAILMGFVILASDIAWLVVAASYTYPPWLALGTVIFVATLAWLAVDFSLMEESRKPEDKEEMASMEQEYAKLGLE